MKDTTRIKLEDSTFDLLEKMSEGNPGALSVLVKTLQEGGKIDPANAFGGLGPILTLDMCGIYGSRIWMLFKDVCKQSLVDTVGLLRANQLGFVSDKEINHAVDNYGQGIDLSLLMASVRKSLEDFEK